MNRANVEALARALMDIIGSSDPDEPVERGCTSLAEDLAGRGVLVPAALTDEQAGQFVFEAVTEWAPPTVATDARAYLERIAKGA